MDNTCVLIHVKVEAIERGTLLSYPPYFNDVLVILSFNWYQGYGSKQSAEHMSDSLT